MLLQQIKTWKINGKIKLCVDIDLGGSGLRGRISNAQNKNQYIDIPHIKAKSSQSLIESLMHIQSSINKYVGKFESCGSAMAVAGPIKHDKAIMTNWPGSPSSRTFSIGDLPPTLFPPKRTVFMNDLESGAYGLFSSSELGILQHHFHPLFERNHSKKFSVISDNRTAVMALGSGLGASLIIRDRMSGKPSVLPSELGHIQIPAVCLNDANYEEERSLLQHASNCFYGGSQTPEFEDLSSGRGLKLNYQYFLNKIEKVKKPLSDINESEVAKLAHNGDEIARLALFWCYKFYIRLAKLIATSIQCESVVLALDNQVKDASFVKSVEEKLKDEFFNFVRPEWMKNIKVFAQIKSLNFNILGCDYRAHLLSSDYV